MPVDAEVAYFDIDAAAVAEVHAELAAGLAPVKGLALGRDVEREVPPFGCLGHGAAHVQRAGLALGVAEE